MNADDFLKMLRPRFYWLRVAATVLFAILWLSLVGGTLWAIIHFARKYW